MGKNVVTMWKNKKTQVAKRPEHKIRRFKFYHPGCWKSVKIFKSVSV
jgi:hypothetical protein